MEPGRTFASRSCRREGLFLLLPAFLLVAAGGCLASRGDGTAPAVERTGPRVGILPFDVKGEAAGDLGRMAQDILVTAFFQRTPFPIVERSKVEALFREQDLSRMDRRVLPLDAVIQGHITAVAPSKETRNWLLWKTVYRRLEVVVDVRCIDVRSGEILYAEKGTREVTTTNKLTLLFVWTVMENDREVSEKAVRGALEDFLLRSVDRMAEALRPLPSWYGTGGSGG